MLVLNTLCVTYIVTWSVAAFEAAHPHYTGCRFRHIV